MGELVVRGRTTVNNETKDFLSSLSYFVPTLSIFLYVASPLLSTA